MRLEDFDNDEDRIIKPRFRKTGMKSGLMIAGQF
jgi:hypothetical protein